MQFNFCLLLYELWTLKIQMNGQNKQKKRRKRKEKLMSRQISKQKKEEERIETFKFGLWFCWTKLILFILIEFLFKFESTHIDLTEIRTDLIICLCQLHWNFSSKFSFKINWTNFFLRKEDAWLITFWYFVTKTRNKRKINLKYFKKRTQTYLIWFKFTFF